VPVSSAVQDTSGGGSDGDKKENTCSVSLKCFGKEESQEACVFKESSEEKGSHEGGSVEKGRVEAQLKTGESQNSPGQAVGQEGGGEARSGQEGVYEEGCGRNSQERSGAFEVDEIFFWRRTGASNLA
jgi:hypothetical protein